MTAAFRIVAIILAAVAGVATARAKWYIELTGSAAKYGYSRAGPYDDLAECRNMANRMNIVANCVYYEEGPTSQQLEFMRQQKEARQAEERRREAERERQRQISYYKTQGNDRLRDRLFDEAINAYEMALRFGHDSIVEGNLKSARFGREFAQASRFFAARQWDLAIDAYRSALLIKPGNAAAESGIRAAENNKRNQLIREEALRQQEEARKKYEAGFAAIQRAIEDHVAFAEAQRRQPPPTVAARKLSFGDPDLKGDQAVREKIAEHDRKIERDMQAIRNLGFARRAEDYEAWVGLSRSAQIKFEEQLLDIIADWAFDKLKDGFFEKIKSFDAAQGVKLVHILESRSYLPKSAGLIERIKIMSRRGNAAGLAEDAKIIVQYLEDLSAADADEIGKKQTLEFVADVLELFVNDPRLKLLVAEFKVAEAAVFNNATRRVALHEVERLTNMTAGQLKALKSVQTVLIKHVKERRELKRLLTEPAP